MEIRPLPRPVPIYVVGDSHVLIYDDRLFQLAAGEGRPPAVALRAVYCREIGAHGCIDAGGALAEPVVRALSGARIIVPTATGLEAFHRTEDLGWRHVAVAEDRSRTDPPLALQFGGLDIFHLGARLGADRIRIPERMRGDAPPELYEAPADAMPFAEAVHVFERYVAPLGELIGRLQALGCGRMAVLTLPPPTTNDDAFAIAVNNVRVAWSPAKRQTPFRYQCTRTMNHVLAALAGRAGVPVIYRWSAQVTGGTATPGLLHDWIHLGSAASVATGAALVDHFFPAAA